MDYQVIEEIRRPLTFCSTHCFFALGMRFSVLVSVIFNKFCSIFLASDDS